MRIVIDCRFSGVAAGLGSYTRAIASRLALMATSECYTLIVRNPNEPWLNALADVCTILPADIAHYSLAEQTRLPSIIRGAGADLLFSPHFNVPLRCPVPFVVTVHDLILHRYPNRSNLLKRAAYRALIDRAIHRARAVIAISDFVREEIVSTYGPMAAAKTSVVLQGVDERFKPAPRDDIDRVRAAYRLDRPYLLYVGNAKQHKNVPLLLEAYRRSGLEAVDFVLVTGGPEARSLEHLPRGARLLAGVPDADLPALYSGAHAFATASLYEGFCLPVAEALACGTPVIATNRAAIPQAAAGRALLLEPDADAYAAAFRDPPARTGSFVVGRWDHTARATRSILLAAASV